jgi:hypothetical protein
VRGSVHHRLAVVVHGVDVGAEVEQHVHRFERFVLLARLLERLTRADTAAAIKGVVWLEFASSGSAPSSRSTASAAGRSVGGEEKRRGAGGFDLRRRVRLPGRTFRRAYD